jgi:lipopolysaccharide transport system permease protein
MQDLVVEDLIAPLALPSQGVNGAARASVADLPPLPDEPLHRIRPPSGWAALNLAETWQFRDLLMTLGTRDLKLRYKQTALGMAWVILQPLVAAGIFSFVFGKVANLKPPGDIPYFVFSYAGLLGWKVFESTLTKAGACLVGNQQLVSKVYFPRLILPLSTVPSTLVDFAVAAGVMAVLAAVTPGVTLSLGVLLLPVWLLLLLLSSLGAGLIASALMVSYRDVQYVLPVFTQFLMYASPVAYGLKNVPDGLRLWYQLNPLSPVLEGFRWSVLGPTAGDMHWGLAAYGASFAVAMFVIGLLAFRGMERRFADVI